MRLPADILAVDADPDCRIAWQVFGSPPPRIADRLAGNDGSRRGRSATPLELGLHRPELLVLLDDLLTEVSVVSVATLATELTACESALRDSVPSRNGSTRDAHLLALARSTRADIWTHDRDFAGTGVATWSTANLMRALATVQD